MKENSAFSPKGEMDNIFNFCPWISLTWKTVLNFYYSFLLLLHSVSPTHPSVEGRREAQWWWGKILLPHPLSHLLCLLSVFLYSGEFDDIGLCFFFLFLQLKKLIVHNLLWLHLGHARFILTIKDLFLKPSLWLKWTSSRTLFLLLGLQNLAPNPFYIAFLWWEDGWQM